ncbi:RagB/SusD family nutrient uptake outer membrane protein [Chryseobacterium polytrichastri]|uniref:SusD family protein n=1 Tax=Chryseobacterium polytrichastri TaxID=1302687 RepID=A0A1M7K0L0_9FLAO|nr:RagB/SusD family nutrient uptake outer membrane protein [Chryseobacterium polytrichastri]SHM58862.1 SusD family protein [Chryseobacterium polytrichastri]
MKTKLSKYLISICAVTCALSFSRCGKQDAFLDKKPNSALAVPNTLSDYELLLKNEEIFNAYSSPSLGNLACDDIYITDDTYNSSETVADNVYTFSKDMYQGTTVYLDWSGPYQQVYYCNVVLDGLSKITPDAGQLTRYNTIKGEALFFRAYAFYNLVQNFALPYDAAGSAADPGIPLVNSSDINIRYGRGTVQQVYDKVVNDINDAKGLLPASLTSVTKPCRITCDAFLARLYLAVRKYGTAYTYANSCLEAKKELVDYNSITPSRNVLSKTPLAEDIFHTALAGYSGLYAAQMDSTLYNSYEPGDLRKSYFFRTATSGIGLKFRGTYDFKGNYYSGLATDEMYLIRSECSARSGNLAASLADLNKLLINRYQTGQFIPITAGNKDTLLRRILLERKKELFLRGLRWTDLRRLNKEESYKTTVTHKINGIIYTLLPDDPKYALAIPDQEVQLTGIQQNQR